MNIVIIGPAYPLRGGLASFDERLTRQFNAEGHVTQIFTFSLQYPGFLFPGTTQYSAGPKPADLNIHVCINSINPLNWLKVGRQLRDLKPDLIVVRYWLPFMAPCLGTILRKVKKNDHTKVICIVDNIIPHEKRPGDKVLTNYFVKPIDAFITMSEKVLQDLRQFTQKPAKLVIHPLYDSFGEPVSKQSACEALGLKNEPIILFFGFIRKYKGLDILLNAMKLLAKQYKAKAADSLPVLPKLLVAGEFYENKENYDALLKDPDIAPLLILRTNFIADDEVKNYLSACDFIIQPYRDATQSGVTPLAYHFEKPMLVTDVGGLASIVPDGKVGVVVAPTAEAVAEGISRLYQIGVNYFIPHLQEEKKKYSWAELTASFLELAKA